MRTVQIRTVTAVLSPAVFPGCSPKADLRLGRQRLLGTATRLRLDAGAVASGRAPSGPISALPHGGPFPSDRKRLTGGPLLLVKLQAGDRPVNAGPKPCEQAVIPMANQPRAAGFSEPVQKMGNGVCVAPLDQQPASRTGAKE